MKLDSSLSPATSPSSSAAVRPKYHIHDYQKSNYNSHRPKWILPVVIATILVVVVVIVIGIYRSIIKHRRSTPSAMEMMVVYPPQEELIPSEPQSPISFEEEEAGSILPPPA
ncbi:hypothetical protein A2U01_0010907 [Trifolium medium]|uniref:Uncharacterized protein n=1 Tax=Trifolium medium TaxID=97028 RepID=A0A392MRD4_9FABA|nr:hypothetical protein [Trifolium medium]